MTEPPSKSSETLTHSFSIYGKDVKNTPIYEDRYCRLTPNELLLKTYFFPLFTPKRIPLQRIMAMYYDENRTDCVHVKSWGCSFTGTWWACDCGRELGLDPQLVNVVLAVDGEATHKGFSVTDFEAFFRALRAVIPHDAAVINGLP